MIGCEDIATWWQLRRFPRKLAIMASRELCADAARWALRRKLTPRSKRRLGKLGGKAKRRRRKFNSNNLTGCQSCACMPHCTCRPDNHFVDIAVQTDPLLTLKTQRTLGTQIKQHTSMLPKAGTFTAGDIIKTKAHIALGRMHRVVKKNFHFTSIMIVLVLRVLFNLIVKFNWGWTQAVGMTAELMQVKTNTVFAVGNNYLESTVDLPAELPTKQSGRGSEAFKANHGADKYSELKEVFAC